MNARYTAMTALTLGLCLAGGCSAPGWGRWGREEAVSSAPTPAQRRAQIERLADAAAGADAAGRERIAGELAAVLAGERDPLMRLAVVRALAPLPATTAEQALARAVKDSDRDVRIAACQGLGRRGGAAAVQALAETFASDTDLDVRLAAAGALGQTEDPAAIPALAAGLDDADPAVQYRAIQSLSRVTGREYGDDVEAWRQYLAGTPPPEPSLAQRWRRMF